MKELLHWLYLMLAPLDILKQYWLQDDLTWVVEEGQAYLRQHGNTIDSQQLEAMLPELFVSAPAQPCQLAREAMSVNVRRISFVKINKPSSTPCPGLHIRRSA